MKGKKKERKKMGNYIWITLVLATHPHQSFWWTCRLALYTMFTSYLMQLICTHMKHLEIYAF